jgi:Ca2+-transporting ATPase
MRTEVGRIGTLIDDGPGSRETPLERKLTQLGHALVGVVLVLCAVIVLAGWLRGNGFLHMLEVGISLAIAAVPEGLPAVATMTLALGMQRMARHRRARPPPARGRDPGLDHRHLHRQDRHPHRDEMTVPRPRQLGERRIDVSGAGYARVGEFSEGDRTDRRPASDAQLALALRIGALCNDATLERTDDGDPVLGDPTEGALLVVAAKAGMSTRGAGSRAPRIGEVPFTARRCAW